jgi:hypothetical protein
MTFHRCFLPSFGSFGQEVSEENIFFKLTNQKQEFPVVDMFLTDRDEKCNLFRGPSIDASYQVLVHLAKRFREDFKKSTNQKQELLVAAMFINGSG